MERSSDDPTHDSNITAFEVFSRAVERNENEYEEADDEIKLKLYTYLIDEESWTLVSEKPSISHTGRGNLHVSTHHLESSLRSIRHVHESVRGEASGIYSLFPGNWETALSMI